MAKKDIQVDLTARIREKARDLWEKGGRQQGKDLEYWLQAEKIVKGQKKRQKSAKNKICIQWLVSGIQSNWELVSSILGSSPLPCLVTKLVGK